jgi:methylmalonyl-CoA mutase N-terminal domain/subunit
VATQNILREEAQLTDVIDPLGGSYYVESLTDAMEAADPANTSTASTPPAACTAVQQGLVQR